MSLLTPKIAIVTDSASDLPVELVKKYDIKVIPLNIHFGEEVYQDGVNLSPKEFYLKLKEFSKIPKTSQPAPGQFMQVYKELLKNHEEVISIHLSSTLSGTYQAALLSKQMLEREEIEVIDSYSGSMGVGFLVLEAAQMAKNGKSKQEIVARVENLKQSLNLIGVFDSLEHLQKGGRIGKAQALLGILLNVKPLLIFHNGSLDTLGKARGRKKAWQTLVTYMQENIQADQPLRVCIMHAAAEEEAKRVETLLRENFQCQEIFSTYLGPTIGTHLGPGVVALTYYKI